VEVAQWLSGRLVERSLDGNEYMRPFPSPLHALGHIGAFYDYLFASRDVLMQYYNVTFL